MSNDHAGAVERLRQHGLKTEPGATITADSAMMADLRTVLSALSRIDAALAEGEGVYRMVPVEPTEAMAHAFRDARPKSAVQEEDGGWSAPAPDWFRAQYRAMLAASPAPTLGVEWVARIILMHVGHDHEDELVGIEDAARAIIAAMEKNDGEAQE